MWGGSLAQKLEETGGNAMFHWSTVVMMMVLLLWLISAIKNPHRGTFLPLSFFWLPRVYKEYSLVMCPHFKKLLRYVILYAKGAPLGSSASVIKTHVFFLLQKKEMRIIIAKANNNSAAKKKINLILRFTSSCLKWIKMAS